MVKRRFPRPRDLAPLMKFKPPELNARKRRLAAALTIYDMCKAADKGIVLEQIRLRSKSGGKSGEWRND